MNSIALPRAQLRSGHPPLGTKKTLTQSPNLEKRKAFSNLPPTLNTLRGKKIAGALFAS